MPEKSMSRLAAMTCSSSTNLLGATWRKRGRTSGTLTRANRSSFSSGSSMRIASERLRVLMYGKGWPGSTASGVRTG